MTATVSDGAETVVPVTAASVMLLRGSPVEVLLIERSERSSFVPGAWVFPGGAVDSGDAEVAAALGDASDEGAIRVAAFRELFEEAGIWLAGGEPSLHDARNRLRDGSLAFRELIADSPPSLDRLVLTSRWITPAGIPKRFDTSFFVAEAPSSAVAIADATEAVAVLWIAPAEALRRGLAGELMLLLPTIRNLEAIAGFATPSAAIAQRAGAEVRTIEPVLRMVGGRRQIVIPGEE